MTASTANPQTHTVEVTRFIRAPRQRVFDAWIKPELRRQWWKTHKGEGLSHCEVDASTGGRYCMKQIGGGCESSDEDPNYEWVMQGEFLEVKAPERLVFTWNVNHDPPVMNDRVTIAFKEVAGGTEVHLRHEGITTQMRDGTKAGWTTHLDAVADLLEQSS